MKGVKLLLASMVILKFAIAQTEDYTSKLIKVLPLSPNAASLGRFGDQPVGCYTGVPKINVPLYTIEAGDIKVPLALDYHNGGVKVEDIASWVGTGWSFSFGGSISRQLRGMPDEAGSYLGDVAAIDQFNSWTVSQKEAFIDWNKLGLNDVQNDIYYYNFGGQSGKFFFKPDGEVVTKPRNKLQFKYGNYFGKYGWKVVNTDGVTYYFLDGEETSTLTTSLPASGDDVVAIGTWYISKIVSAQGTESIDFEYGVDYVSYNSNLTYTAYQLNPQNQADINDAPNCGEGLPISSVTFNHINELKLKKIKFPNGEVIVNAKSTARLDLEGSHALESIQIKNKEGREIKRYDFVYSTWQAGRLFLDAVNVSANAVSLGDYKFEYHNPNALPPRDSQSQDHWGYFNGADNTGRTPIPYCYIFGVGMNSGKVYPRLGADRSPDPSNALAGSLTKMSYPTGGYTEYTMESNTASNVQALIERGFDLKAGSDRFQIYGDAAGAKIEYDGSFNITEGYGSSGGVMTKIEIGLPGSSSLPPPPMGDADPEIQLFKPDGTMINLRNNTVLFMPIGNYRMHVNFSSNPDPELIRNFFVILTWDYGVIGNPQRLKNVVVGGLRIKSIKDVDPVSGHTYERNYNYLYDDGTSTGVIGSFPNYKGYKYECRNSGLTFCNKITLGSISQSSMVLTQGSYVGYGMVDEFFDQGNNGKNRYTYTTFLNFNDKGDFQFFPYYTADSRDEFRGVLLNQKTYKKISNQYVPVSEKSYKYNFRIGDGYYPNDPFTVVTKGWSFRQYVFYIGCGYIDGTQFHLYLPFNTTTGWIKLNSETSRIYDQDNINKYAEIVTDYEYSDRNMQVNKVTTKKSNGDISVVKYKFPLDYVFTSAATDNKVKGIAALVDKYKINQPVETSTYISKNGGDLQLVNSNLVAFDPVVTNPGAVFSFDNKGPVNDFTPSDVQSDIMVIDNRYTPKVTYNQYLSNGRVAQQQKVNDVLKSYLWDYDNMYAIAEVTNADVSQIAYTSFETDYTGRWSLNAGSSYLTNNGNITGKRSLAGGVNTTVPQGNYILSLWSSSAPIVNGQATSVQPLKSIGNGKSFYQIELTGISSVNVSGNNIDEVRLYPKGAEMSTVTYEPLVGVTSQSDIRGYINYYEYDAAGRLSVIRNEAGQIVKSINYHYMNQ
jgi:hypothetical protein